MEREEKFKVLPVFSKYEIGDKGTIRMREGTNDPRFPPGYELSQRMSKRGFRTVKIRRNGENPTTQRVHQLVLTAFGPKKPKGWPIAMHKDGNKENNCIENLVWGTLQDCHRPTTALKTDMKKMQIALRRIIAACESEGLDDDTIRFCHLQATESLKLERISNI